jgi:ankyrin repeat protein
MRASVTMFSPVRIKSVNEEKIEKRLDEKQYFDQLKKIALHQDIVGNVAGMKIVSTPLQVRVNQQDTPLIEEKTEKILFPSQKNIDECKSTRELMEIFATPFKCYLLNQKELINSGEKVPPPVSLFIKYWRQIRNENLPIISDRDNQIKTNLDAIEHRLNKSLLSAINRRVSDEKEEDVMARCVALINQGASVNIASFAYTLLSTAAYLGMPIVVKGLLELGANIKADSDQNWPIVHAVIQKHADVVKLLLDKHLQDHSSQAERAVEHAFEIAVRNNDLNMIKLFDGYFRAHDSSRTRVIFAAAARDDVGVAQHLTSLANTLYPEDFWKTDQSIAMTTFIKIHGIDKVNQVRIKTPNGDVTVLAYALENHHKDVAEILIRAKADVTVARHNGMLPFMLAAKRNYWEFIAPCLEFKGSDINKTDANGETALVHAIKHGNKHNRYHTVKQLLDLGANPCVEYKEVKEVKQNPPAPINTFMLEFNKPLLDEYHYNDFCNGFNPKILKALYDAMKDKEFVKRLFWRLIQEWQCDEDNKIGTLISLLGAEAVSEMKNDCGETPLIFLLRLGRYEMAECLVEHKVGVYAHTALIKFVNEENLDACKFLIKHGVDAYPYRDEIFRIIADKKNEKLSADFLEALNLSSKCLVM